MIGKDICSRIKGIRQAMKLTQSQFAELTNISEDSLGKIEREVNVPSLDTLYKVAKGIKMPLTELLSPFDEKTAGKVCRELEDLLTYLKTKSPDEIELIHELAVKILDRPKK
ncbi:MAG: helix-turn-helix domain-containing protein [Deltaproteobacteria bacterium]|nr:helix-turn-helix domain-containing protein [Deltaproteobacteria bacterium]